MTELKQKHELGQARDGINLFVNKVEDCLAAGIVEPVRVKLQAVASSSEVATMILRIDDVLASNGSRISVSKPNPYEGLD
jgi:chaperonin GroEL (HSP60 family)